MLLLLLEFEMYIKENQETIGYCSTSNKYLSEKLGVNLKKYQSKSER